MAFSFRARAAGVPMYAALDARVDHAGRSMVLELHKGELAMRLFDVP
jgi:GT2 family glycosyltransferase